MNAHEIEVVGAAGHGAGVTINLLGVLWNWKGSLFFKTFHIAAASVHAYALYTHVRRARRLDGQEK